jgi:hypothetical protein
MNGNYEYDVHFDAENPDGTGCHFVFPTDTLAHALEMQRTWLATYQGIATAITTVIIPHVPKKKAA